MHVGGRPRLVDLALTLGLATAIACLDPSLGPIVVAGNALGKASLAVLTARAIVARGDDRGLALARLGGAALLPMVLVAVLPALHLTALLHPATYDGALYRIDAALGGQASFALGRLFMHQPALALLCRFVYLLLPIAVAALLIVPPASGARPARSSMAEAFVAAGALGLLVYHLCPAAGPIYAFQATYPWTAPAAGDVSSLPLSLGPFPRNCVPSLHTTWALLMLWHARPRGRAATVLAAIWLVLTEIATLGLGEHYLVDLAIAVPFAVGVDALVQRGVPLSRPERSLPIATGAALVGLWVIAIRDPEAHLAGSPIAARALTIATVAIPLALRSKLSKSEPQSFEIKEDFTTPATGVTIAIAGLAGASAIAAAVHVAIAGRWILSSIGATPSRAALVLAACVGGAAIGGIAGARASERRDAGAAMGRALLAIAAWCGLAPIVVPALRAAHAAAAPHAPRAPLAIALAVAATLPSTFAAGATLPLAARLLRDRGAPPARAAIVAWAAGAAGVALGAKVTIAGLVPLLGPVLATIAITIAPLVAAVGAMTLRAREKDAAASFEEPGGSASPTAVLGAAVAFGVLGVHAHLLTILAGSTWYAIASAIVAVAGGLAIGASTIGASALGSSARGTLTLGIAVAALAIAFVWPALPAYFASFEGYSVGRTFAEREAVRLAVAWLTLAPPAIAAGALHAQALGRVGPSLRAMSRAAAAMTLARIAGVAIAVFALVPRLGALRAVHALAAIAAALAVVDLAPALRRRRFTELPRAPLAIAMGAAALFAATPRRLDPALIAEGSHLGFAERGAARVIDHEERPFAVTTIASRTDGEGRRHVERAVNGEAIDEGHVVAHAALHMQARAHALAIGASPDALRAAGVGDVAEIAPGEARPLLLADRRAWDAIAIIPPPPWRAGSASLSTRDFFALARTRLTPSGVIATRIELRYVAREDVAAVVGAARAELPEVWIHGRGSAATLVACAAPCPVEGRADDELVLDPSAVTRLVARSAEMFGSAAATTDDDLRVERHAPRGLVRAAEGSAKMNFRFLRP